MRKAENCMKYDITGWPFMHLKFIRQVNKSRELTMRRREYKILLGRRFGNIEQLGDGSGGRSFRRKLDITI